MTNQHTYTVVVGVDGSPSAKAALRWAVWHASLANGRITALQTWDLPPMYSWEVVPGIENLAHDTAAVLRKTIDEVVGDHTVEINREVAQGHPARALVDAAKEASADLLVVGNRGHGGFTGALLGSVSQHVVHHARCPVVIVREGEASD